MKYSVFIMVEPSFITRSSHGRTTAQLINTYCNDYLTLSALQAKTSTFANSVDPDEMARNEPSHQDLPCLSFCVDFCLTLPICYNGYVQIQRRKNSIQKLKGEVLSFT